MPQAGEIDDTLVQEFGFIRELVMSVSGAFGVKFSVPLSGWSEPSVKVPVRVTVVSAMCRPPLRAQGAAGRAGRSAGRRG